jgi:hypothetical protein
LGDMVRGLGFELDRLARYIDAPVTTVRLGRLGQG